MSERKKVFTTLSWIPLKEHYSPEDVADLDYEKDLNAPGRFPFTRGIHSNMYRGRLWTMRQFSGFGTPEDTNRRYKYLLENGQTGLSMAFDMPTLMGVDSDSPLASGEVGKCGVAVDTLRDMEIIFDGIDMGAITTSMTINGPAAVLLALYVAAAEKQGVPYDCIGGTTQNDMLKEFIAQKSWIFPPEPSVKIVIDIVEFCTKHLPKWNTISISGYHIREAGATAVQELAFTLADGIEYVRQGIRRGLDVDEFAPRLSFFFDCHNNFFEEIAKFRAARRMWARIMKEKFGAKKERSMWLRFHTQTAGCTLTAQQPMNNIVRVTIQALAAVLGGTQSLHTNSMDETYALPTEEAVRVALRTQQILAEESGVADVVDPLGGSYFVEKLTSEMEEKAWQYIEKIENMGGMLAAIEDGYPQKEISDAAYKQQLEFERGERTIVGVNKYVIDEDRSIPILRIDPEVEKQQVARLNQVKRERNDTAVSRCLRSLRRAAEEDKNLIPYILDCVRNYVTEGEIIETLKEVYGAYTDPAYI